MLRTPGPTQAQIVATSGRPDSDAANTLQALSCKLQGVKCRVLWRTGDPGNANNTKSQPNTVCWKETFDACDLLTHGLPTQGFVSDSIGSMHRLRVALCHCFLYVARVTSTVVHLTDSTFESATQASTGQTTGHWSVLFWQTCSSRAGKCMPARSKCC